MYCSYPKMKQLQAAERFFNASTENRELIALQAFKGDRPWPYSFPLDTAVMYLRAIETGNYIPS